MSSALRVVDTAPAAVPIESVEGAMEVVADTSLTLEERAVPYVLLRDLRKKIDRVIKPVGREILEAMARAQVNEWGPLYIGKGKPIEPRYVCNDEGNWLDDGVRDQLLTWREMGAFRPFIKRIPDHLEVDKGALGKAYADGDPAARDFYRLLNERKYRVEVGRTPELKVREGRRS